MDDNKIEIVVREVFQMNEKESLDGVAPGLVPQWDSLGHVALISAVEKTFDIQFSEDEIAQIDSLESLKEVVKRHVSRQT